jgi:hypothetical protein
MALARGRVNPLNVINFRKLRHIPPHFARMTARNLQHIDLIDNWIYHNLESRYCVRIGFVLDHSRKLTEVCEIGVEEPKELSMLSLSCPYLN